MFFSKMNKKEKFNCVIIINTNNNKIKFTI